MTFPATFKPGDVVIFTAGRSMKNPFAVVHDGDDVVGYRLFFCEENDICFVLENGRWPRRELLKVADQ